MIDFFIQSLFDTWQIVPRILIIMFVSPVCFAGIDPRIKVATLCAMSLMVVSLDNEKILFFLFIISLFAYPAARLSGNKYWIAFIFIALGLWGTIFSQALFYREWPRTIVLTLIPQEFPVLGNITGGLYVYKEGFFMD